jgi:AcrR family transcriptional regulator
MPRHADPAVEERVIHAARRLWAKGGYDSLSMRAVARAARTNTPAIYRRFRDKKDILRAIVERAQKELFAVLEPCTSFEEAAAGVLNFALANVHDYELVTSGMFTKAGEPRPNVEFMKQRGSEWFGGSPEDYGGLVLGLWALIHGTAMLLISQAVTDDYATELRAVFPASVETLVRTRRRKKTSSEGVARS